jgi:tetratricopeptide (TPR) repeat protein
MDELCEDLRRTLGESIAQIAQAHLRLEDVTTPSLEALELYSRANVLESEGNYRDASVLLDRAIAIDSLFTMAVSDAAYAHRKIGEDSLAAFYHSRVLPLLPRVTERERLEIMISYYGPSFALDFQKAFQAVQQLTALDPNNAYAYAMLGHLAMNAGDTEAALAANEKAVALFPDYAKICYNNSGYALALDGKGGDALGYFRRAKELRPTYSAIDCYIAQTHWVNGDLDSAVRTAEAILPVADPTRRNQVRVLLGSLFFFQGRLGRAWQELSLCAGAYRAMKKPGDEAYVHWMLGEVAAEEGRIGDYRREMTMAERLCSSPFFELALVGCSFAKHGSVAEGERVARKIQVCRSYDPLFVRRSDSFVHLVKAGLLFAERRYRKAQGEFEAIERVQAGDPLYLIALKGIADCLSAEGDTATYACYAALLARRGEAIMGTLSPLRNSGPWASWLWPEIHLALGRLYAAAGQNDVAVNHLRAALRCWQNADGIYRKAAEARGLLAHVGGKE